MVLLKVGGLFLIGSTAKHDSLVVIDDIWVAKRVLLEGSSAIYK